VRLRFTLLLVVAGCELALPIHESVDGGVDAGGDGREQTSDTVFCGPTLACSISNPQNGCCVTFADSGSPPQNFIYSCLTKDQCAEAGSPYGAQILQCDEPSDCNAGQVCCWPSTNTPRISYCFAQDAGNCFTEMCNPNDAVPCRNHPTFNCAPTRPGWPDQNPPLGYTACRNPNLGP
jgi:hypothetical protein